MEIERGAVMVSETKRRNNARWDAENMKLVSAKIKKDKAEEFKRLCEENGDTMNQVLQAAVDEYIRTHK